MSSLPRLSPTSYALLGLLARGPASAYDLNTTMQTSLIRVFWPRAESHVYSEPKKLLAHGLVSESREQSGGRSRKVYSITDQGRSALAEWLGEDSAAEHRSQAEFMLRLILADGGEVADARATLDRALRTCEAEIDTAIEGIEAILADMDPASAGMPYNGIGINLMTDILAARYRWSHYARESLSQLEQDSTAAQRLEQGTEAYQRALETLRALRETRRS